MSISDRRKGAPVTPETDADRERRAGLAAVAEALRPLHQRLIGLMREEYELLHGPIGGPVPLHRLLLSDPFFAWLMPMLKVMAEVDEHVDQQQPIGVATASVLKKKVEALVSTTGDPPHPFATRYVELLQTSHDLILAHLPLRHALKRL